MNIFCVPYCGGSKGTNLGCENGPKAITDELETIFLAEDLSEVQRYSIKYIENIPESVELAQEFIYSYLENELHDNNFNFFIGGDHSITFSIFKAEAEKNLAKDLGLIVFDSHFDCCGRTNPPTHEDYVSALIEEKVLDPSKILYIGIRNPEKEEVDFVKRNSIEVIYMRDFYESGLKMVIGKIKRWLSNLEKFHLTIDIDVLDPAYAPGTGWPEPAGMASRELLFLLQSDLFMERKKFSSADLVEINPKKDVNRITARLGARIIMEILSQKKK